MSIKFTASSFSNLDEIGPRLRTLRCSKNLTSMSVTQSAGVHYSSIAVVEKGGGAILSIEKISETLESAISIQVTLHDKTQKIVKLSEMQDLINQQRLERNWSRTEIDVKSGTTSGTFKIFEFSTNPRLKSLQKYAEGLSLDMKIQLLVNNEPWLPKADSVNKALKSEKFVLKSSSSSKSKPPEFAKSMGEDFRAIRESRSLSLNKLIDYRASSLETGVGSLISASKLAKKLDKNLNIVFVDEFGESPNIEPEEVAIELDRVREIRGISHAEMARLSGGSYRSMRIFTDAKLHSFYSIDRYASALGDYDRSQA